MTFNAKDSAGTFPDGPSQDLGPHADIDGAGLIKLALECGADDAGVVSVDSPPIDTDREFIKRAFPSARTLLAIVCRMHREPVRSPTRSLANLEFHNTGHETDAVARRIVRRLEDMGIGALNAATAFPMELDDFPSRGWIVSHKLVAEAAGLGRMGIHRSLIHPKFGSFVLLGTVMIDAEIAASDGQSKLLERNPCLECKLCVSACPVGAIKPDGYFDFSACFTHNYQQFMGGFVNWIEDVVASRSAQDYASKVSYAETVNRWQSLSYGPNYNAAYCLAVCPAGEDVIGPYLTNRIAHVETVVKPLQDKVEPIYVSKGTDAADYVARRYPHKRIRWVKPSGRATNINSFLFGIRLGFQPGKALSLDARYHFTFGGAEQVMATVVIRNKRLTVDSGHVGTPDLQVFADARTWIRFLNKEVSILRCLATRKIRLKGPPRLLVAFGRCFPA